MENGESFPLEISTFAPGMQRLSLPQKGKENEEFLEISGELRYFIANSKAFLGSDLRSCFPS